MADAAPGMTPDMTPGMAADPPASRRARFRSSALGRLLRHRSGAVGLALSLTFVLVAVFGGLVAPYEFARPNYIHALEGPSAQFLLGTDPFGRDTFSRLLYGARYSIGIGVSAALLAAVIGGLWGLLAGYMGGVVDGLSMRLVDVMLAFPGLLLAIGLITLTGPGFWPVLLATTVFGVPLFARLARGQTLAVKERLFVEAARGLGSSHARLLLQHLLPAILSPLLVYATLRTGVTMLVASGLSFLGLGLQPPTPEWGAMLSDAQLYLRTHPILAFAPGVAITLAVLGFNLLGDGLRDVLDPTFRGRG